MIEIEESIENYVQLIDEIRSMALNDQKPSTILSHLVVDKGIPDKVKLLHTFRSAFNASISDVSPISGWQHNGEGELSSEQIDFYLTPVLNEFIEKNKRENR